jgi:hypothetical protein
MHLIKRHGHLKGNLSGNLTNERGSSMLVEHSKITHATRARQRKTRPRARQRPDGTPDEGPGLLRELHFLIGQLLGRF